MHSINILKKLNKMFTKAKKKRFNNLKRKRLLTEKLNFKLILTDLNKFPFRKI